MGLIKRLNDSVRARAIEPFLESHYKLTSMGGILSSFKDKYKGERCFFIGNGPSLKPEDLTKLYENREITFAFNRIYNIFDLTPWRPDYYISQDEKMISGCLDAVDRQPLGVKLIPIELKWYYNVNIKDAVYFRLNWNQNENPDEFKFSDDIAREVYSSSTVTYSAAQFAAFMGFSEIYLIGVDHHFHISKNNKGETVVDDSVKDYFSDKYNEDRNNLYIPNTEKSSLTYIALKNQCEKRNIKVFNATRGGKLEVFTRVDFDKLFLGGVSF